MINRIAKYTALFLAGLLLFYFTHEGATIRRGYDAIGGEAVFILLPLLWWALSVPQGKYAKFGAGDSPPCTLKTAKK